MREENLPLISIIIPAYNEEDHIEDCLQSIIAQTYKPIEIVVVDDGSIDLTPQLVESLGIRLLHQVHGGPGLARNLGASNTTGPILVFADADEKMHSQYIEKLVAPILAEEAIGTVPAEVYSANDSDIWGRYFNWYWGIPVGGEQTAHFLKEEDAPPPPIFRAIMRSEFNKVGGFDNVGYSDDQSISLKLGILPLRAPGTILYHYNHNSLKEVFRGERWRGRGTPGWKPKAKRLSQTFFPISLAGALIVAAKNRELGFISYKLIFDFAQFIGTLESIVLPNRHYK